jgi:hypothetical protein
MSKRPIPQVNIKEYAHSGFIGIFPAPPEVQLQLGKSTVFLNEVELVDLCASLISAGYGVFGRGLLEPLRDFISYKESQ